MKVSGIHQVMNALAASTAALALGLTLEDCRAGLEAAEISPWRMQVREVDGAVIVNDCLQRQPDLGDLRAADLCGNDPGPGGAWWLSWATWRSSETLRRPSTTGSARWPPRWLPAW